MIAVALEAAFASKPAPTLDRVPTLECIQMWERACSRRGRPSHHEPYRLGKYAGKQPGLGDLRHGLIRQLAVTLTLRSAGGNLRQDAIGTGVQFGHRHR